MIIKLIARNVFRHKLRAILTILGVAIAVSSFGFIRTVITAWYIGVEASSSNRIVTRNAISIGFPLPLAYKNKLESTPDVLEVTYANWFGGIYKDPGNFFAQFAVDPVSYFNIYSEYKVRPEEMQAFLKDRSGAIVGQKLVERYGWKVGDIVPIKGTIYEGDWDFTIRGIYKGTKKSADESTFFFHWKYLDERVAEIFPDFTGNVGFYIATIGNPDNAALVCQSIDERFKNSANETLTETESAFQLSFVTMSSAIISSLEIVSFVIIAIIMLVLANTMVMSARERTSEYAVIKTLGFEPGFIYAMIVGESLLLSSLGALLGLLITFPIVNGFADAVGSFFPSFDISTMTLIAAVIATLVVGALSGIIPAIRAAHLNIIDGLRQLS